MMPCPMIASAFAELNAKAQRLAPHVDVPPANWKSLAWLLEWTRSRHAKLEALPKRGCTVYDGFTVGIRPR